MKPARLPHAPAAAESIRITGATVIDGTGTPPREAVDIDIVDGTIVYVGPARPSASRPDRLIDARGGYVMPGFIDTHVHLTMPNGSREEDERTKFPEEHAFATAASLRLTVEAGVTTARDLAGLTPGYRNAIADGGIVGPRLHLAIAMLSPTGGHADPVRANGSPEYYTEFEHTPSWAVVDTDAEVIRAVRTLVRTGADVIKVCTTGGISTPEDQPDDLGLSEDQVRLVVAETRRRGGQPVAAHAQGHEGALAAVRGGVSSLEHGYEMTDALVEAMLELGTVLVPTLSTLSLTPDPAVRPAAVVAKKLEWQRRGRRAATLAIEAGVPIALGTDAGIHPHGRNLAELGHLVDSGMEPIEAIRSGTLVGAGLMGLADRLGSVEEGKLADLILTRVDPLAHIHDLADHDAVRAVLMGGHAVKDLDGVTSAR